MSPIRMVIFASGKGSNARALLAKAGSFGEKIIPLAIISDRTDAGAHAVAKEFSIPSYTIPAKDSAKLMQLLADLKAEWAFLAGYMRILPASILNFFQGRILNVHPSLLPAYAGLHGYERAFADKIPESGITIHWVDAGLDTGPIIRQKKFPRFADDSLEEFMARGQKIEHEIYGDVLADIANGKLQAPRGEL